MAVAYEEPLNDCWWDKSHNEGLFQPNWVCKAVQKYKIGEKYSPWGGYLINREQWISDFDGDKKLDVAVWVKNKQSNKQGIIIFNSSSEAPIVIGAGNKTIFGDDLSGFNLWTVLSKQKLTSPLESVAVTPNGDAIFLNSPEDMSAVLYWDGNEYRWFRISN